MGAREELAAIRERVEAATEGPWVARHCGGGYRADGSVFCNGGHANGVWSEGATVDVVREELTSADADLIAHARTDVSRLVEALEAVVKVLDEAGTQAAATYRSDGDRFNEGQLDAVELVETRVLAAIEAALTTDTKEADRG